jgi:hypothetical protein
VLENDNLLGHRVTEQQDENRGKRRHEEEDQSDKENQLTSASG